MCLWPPHVYLIFIISVVLHRGDSEEQHHHFRCHMNKAFQISSLLLFFPLAIRPLVMPASNKIPFCYKQKMNVEHTCGRSSSSPCKSRARQVKHTWDAWCTPAAADTSRDVRADVTPLHASGDGRQLRGKIRHCSAVQNVSVLVSAC